MEGFDRLSENLFDCRWPNNTNCHITPLGNFLFDMKEIIDIAQIGLSFLVVLTVVWMIAETSLFMRAKRKHLKK